MSIKYSLALMSTKPGDDTAKKMYYAKAQADGVVTMDEMAEEISYATSLTDGDVLNVLRALIRQMKVQLAAGKIVKMETSGHSRFRYAVQVRKPRRNSQPTISQLRISSSVQARW